MLRNIVKIMFSVSTCKAHCLSCDLCDWIRFLFEAKTFSMVSGQVFSRFQRQNSSVGKGFRLKNLRTLIHQVVPWIGQIVFLLRIFFFFFGGGQVDKSTSKIRIFVEWSDCHNAIFKKCNIPFLNNTQNKEFL